MGFAGIQHVIGRRSSYIASVYSLYLSVVPKLQLKFGSPFPIFQLIVHCFSLKISVFFIASFSFLQNVMSLCIHTYFFFFKLHENCYVLFAALFSDRSQSSVLFECYGLFLQAVVEK